MTRLLVLILGAVLGASEAPVHRVAFGSCVNQNDAQPLPAMLSALDADVFIFAGDNVYADTHDMDVMRAAYAKLGASRVLTELRARSVVLATWDDHDFGMNDAWSSYPQRVDSRTIFLDFWQVPPESPRRRHEGIYDSWSRGPAGRRLQVILLDVRYNKGDPLKAKDPATTLLGAQQWAWLEHQLREPADVRLIVSGIQVLNGETSQPTTERWLGYPHEQERLFALIRSTQATGVLFLSGDRHFGELSRRDADVGYPLWDLTSSSIKLSKLADRERINPHRVGAITFPSNVGIIDIDWNLPDPLVTLRLRRLDGTDALTQIIPLSHLRP